MEQPAEATADISRAAGAARRWWIVLALLAITFGTLWRVDGNGFVYWGDTVNVVQNPHFYPVNIANALSFWTAPYERLYTPVVYSAWTLIASVSPMPSSVAAAPSTAPPLGADLFHLANLLLHGVNALLVFALLIRLVRVDWAAAIGALLFALHPVQIESVAWVTGLREVLGGTLALGALLLYVVHAQRAKANSAIRFKDAAWVGSIALFAMALLCTLNFVAMPLAAGAIDLILIRRPPRKMMEELAPWLAVAALLWWVSPRANYAPQHVTPAWARPVLALDALGFYFAKIAWPVALCFDYGRRAQVVLGGGVVYFSWLAPVAAGALAFALRRRAPMVAAACLVFLAALLPVLGLIPVAFEDQSIVADRYLYLAMLGPALLAAWGAARWRPSRALLTAAIVLGLYGVKDWSRIKDWRDTQALAAASLKVNPDSEMALAYLGEAQLEDRHPASAIPYLQRATQVRPTRGRMHFLLGQAYEDVGRLDDAIDELGVAARQSDGDPVALAWYANALLRDGRASEALDQFQSASNLSSPDPARLNWAREQYARALTSTGHPKRAIGLWRQILGSNHHNAAGHCALGQLLVNQRDYRGAVDEYQQALQDEPFMQAAREGYQKALAKLDAQSATRP